MMLHKEPVKLLQTLYCTCSQSMEQTRSPMESIMPCMVSWRRWSHAAQVFETSICRFGSPFHSPWRFTGHTERQASSPSAKSDGGYKHSILRCRKKHQTVLGRAEACKEWFTWGSARRKEKKTITVDKSDYLAWGKAYSSWNFPSLLTVVKHSILRSGWLPDQRVFCIHMKVYVWALVWVIQSPILRSSMAWRTLKVSSQFGIPATPQGHTQTTLYDSW